jgi:hypothetical protein
VGEGWKGPFYIVIREFSLSFSLSLSFFLWFWWYMGM